MHRVWETGDTFDAVTVFDADNLVSSTFLRTMDAHLRTLAAPLLRRWPEDPSGP